LIIHFHVPGHGNENKLPIKASTSFFIKKVHRKNGRGYDYLRMLKVNLLVTFGAVAGISNARSSFSAVQIACQGNAWTS